MLVVALKLKILIDCLLLVSISVHVHFACVCVAVYWASPLILIFQVMTLIVISPPTWILTTTLGITRTSRSVQTSSSIRSETPYDAYPVLSVVERTFTYFILRDTYSC